MSEGWHNSVLTGDVRDRLADLPDSSIHCCMTSPPYFGLRDYGVDGQIGLEDSLDAYIQELVAVGRELRRVLRPDGAWWLNLGDSYSGSWGAQSHDADQNREAVSTPDKNPARDTPLGRKQKMLVPHRTAIALQEDGWVVRNDVTWVKPNPMPQSVKDRLNTTTEQIFLLTPEPDYWFDLDAIREPYSEETVETSKPGYGWSEENQAAAGEHGTGGANGGGINDTSKSRHEFLHPAGKNPGDVFEVTTKPFPDAHFAVYPPELCEKPIKATAPPKVCAECGTPYERDVERSRPPEPAHRDPDHRLDDGEAGNVDRGRGIGFRASKLSGQEWNRYKRDNPDQFNGWRQACGCSTDATEPGIVLNPFAGAGTTLLKAKELGRRFVGVELNPEYADMARARVGLSPEDPSHVRDDDAQQGLETYTDGGGADE
jgi:DNA modification methylase